MSSAKYYAPAANDPQKGPIPISTVCRKCGSPTVRGPDGANWCYKHGPQ